VFHLVVALSSASTCLVQPMLAFCLAAFAAISAWRDLLAPFAASGREAMLTHRLEVMLKGLFAHYECD